MTNNLETLLQQPPFRLSASEKEAVLLPLINSLTADHLNHCAAYRKIIEQTSQAAAESKNLAEVPFLPVSLFKYRHLRSVADADIRTTVRSSGTSGSALSQIDLDATTAKLASRALNQIIGSATNNQRRPILIIDSESALEGKNKISARASAILGLMPYGIDPCFALNDDLTFNHSRVAAYLEKHKSQSLLIFGFTFLVWQTLLPACQQHSYDLSNALLLHSGGWKKLEHLAVDNATFKEKLLTACGIQQIKNFYGMAELPGTIFLEGDDGLLHAPNFAAILIRDQQSFDPSPKGQSGLIEIISALPHSYPGHALLTEDLGVIDPASGGLRVLGRAPRAELRGCSDVIASEAA